MKKIKYPVIIIIILLQFVLLIFIVNSQENLLKVGRSIYLKLVPIDPRSLMQGDYVILNYNISRVDIEGKDYSTVKIVLKLSESGYYIYSHQYVKGEELNSDEIMIKGQKIGNRINYGIESYFVEEGTGLEVEGRAKYALVKITKDGTAKLIQLSDRVVFNN